MKEKKTETHVSKTLTCVKTIKPGDNSNVDLMVGDIYGPGKYEKLGLKSTVIASSLGKLATRKDDEIKEPPK